MPLDRDTASAIGPGSDDRITPRGMSDSRPDGQPRAASRADSMAARGRSTTTTGGRAAGSTPSMARERSRVPHLVHDALEAGTGPGPALGQAHRLVAPDRHLARSQPGEAHPSRCRRAHQTATMDLGLETESGERRSPRLAQPVEGAVHVLVPPLVTHGDEHVDPHGLAGYEQHRSPAAAPAGHLDALRRQRGDVDTELRLGRAQDQCRVLDLQHPDGGHQRCRPLECVQVPGRAVAAFDLPPGGGPFAPAHRRMRCRSTATSANRPGRGWRPIPGWVSGQARASEPIRTSSVRSSSK